MKPAGGTSVPNEELLEAYRRGDPVAITSVVKLAAPIADRVLQPMLRNPASQFDVVQDVSMRLWRAHRSYGHGAFEPWVRVIAKRCALDFLRRERRSRLDYISELEPEDPSPSPEHCVSTKEIYEELVDSLSEEERRIWDHLEQGWGQERTADKLGINRNKIRTFLKSLTTRASSRRRREESVR